MIDQDERPAPDALLAEASKEGRGRLKVFLGAYPGVGKTYGMLQAAHERRRDGGDVVVGIVETHGREETEALVRGLAVLPRKKLLHRGQVFGEMDLEAILWRKPALVLVDELAHTNVPGSRHPKRWQDVEELLEAGIDVWTTLNIQHIESLNDVVTRIVGVPVRETVPDGVLEIADSIALVDLPPDELIGRLREGKVYVPEQAGRAIRNFFSKGNLAALRELALRVAAQRADADVLGYMRAHAVQGPWPLTGRLMVCINESPVAKKLVRSARRMAERQQIPWIALFVRTPASEALDDVARARVSETLRLAESLGAETVTLAAESNVVSEVLAFARNRNVTQLILGRPRRRRFSGLLREHVARDLVERATEFEVTLIAPGEEPSAREAIGARLPRDTWRWRGYAWATGIVALATAAAYGVFSFLPLPNISLVFVVAVMVVAVRFGLGASIWASVLSFLAYNFFFTVPYHTLSVFREHELFTIVFFLVVAVLVANLAGRLHRQVAAMRAVGKRTANLFEFSSRVAGAATLDGRVAKVVEI